MDFRTYTNKIMTHFQIQLSKEVANKTVLKINKYVEGYYDLDVYKDKVLFFISPENEFTFEELSNESKAVQNTLDIFMTFRNEPEKVLEDNMKIYAEALVELLKKDFTLGGLVNYAIISRIKFYDGVEGQTSAKALFVELQIVFED